MRITVTLDDDVAAALQTLRREQGLTTSTALNMLVRRGLAAPPAQQRPFRQRSSGMGRPLVPLHSTGGALERIEGESHQ